MPSRRQSKKLEAPEEAADREAFLRAIERALKQEGHTSSLLARAYVTDPAVRAAGRRVIECIRTNRWGAPTGGHHLTESDRSVPPPELLPPLI